MRVPLADQANGGHAAGVLAADEGGIAERLRNGRRLGLGRIARGQGAILCQLIAPGGLADGLIVVVGIEALKAAIFSESGGPGRRCQGGA